MLIVFFEGPWRGSEGLLQENAVRRIFRSESIHRKPKKSTGSTNRKAICDKMPGYVETILTTSLQEELTHMIDTPINYLNGTTTSENNSLL